MEEQATVEETIKKIVTRILRKQDVDITSNATFKEAGADSLDIVQILVALEDNYDIELQDEDLKAVKNMKEFVEYVKSKVAQKSG
jgi:acyl carrier protein